MSLDQLRIGVNAIVYALSARDLIYPRQLHPSKAHILRMGRPVARLKRKADTREAAFGAVITELRVKKGLGYEEVAHKVGCNPSYMNDIERGKQNPSLRVIQAIADVHGIKLSKIIAMAERKYEKRRR